MTETPPRRLAARPKGLSANIGATLTQPISLFRSLVEAPQRQWLTIALIVLILVGLAAVRFDARLRESAAGGIATEGGVPISPSGGGGVPPPGGGGGGVPPPSGGGGDLGGGGTAPPTTADVGTVWTTALLAGTRLALMWGGMAILLSLVSLLQGRAPDMALNLHVAIWSSLPLGVMALLQIIYYGMGGAVGGGGLPTLIQEWAGFQTASPTGQALLLAAAGQVTLFWLWSLLLLYFGARHSLKGSVFAALVVTLLWAVIVIALPVISGAVKAPISAALP